MIAASTTPGPQTLDCNVTMAIEGRPAVRAPEQLQLHPALRELHWTPADEFGLAAQSKNQHVTEPILITSSGIILAGFGHWQLALLEGSSEIHCIEYPFNNAESLQFILRHHQIRRGWNAFVRICLALILESYFQQRALDNMRAGGKNKGSAFLPEVQHIDVREQIASIAGACPRYISTVKTILKNAHPRLIAALQDGSLSINRAMRLCQLPKAEQIEQLVRHLEDREISKAVRSHIPAPGAEKTTPDTATILDAIQLQESRKPGSTVVRVGRLQRTVILVGRGLDTRQLAQGELN